MQLFYVDRQDLVFGPHMELQRFTLERFVNSV
jgi:hypothetical protein